MKTGHRLIEIGTEIEYSSGYFLFNLGQAADDCEPERSVTDILCQLYTGIFRPLFEVGMFGIRQFDCHHMGALLVGRFRGTTALSCG